MTKLKQIASNMTVLRHNGNQILYSYETPVAVYDAKECKYLRTEYKWSHTTSRHITKWLDGVTSEPVPQSIINEYVEG